MPSLSRFHFLLNNAVFLLLLASCLLVEANNPFGAPPPAPYKQNPGHYGDYGQFYSGDSSSNAGVPVQFQMDEGSQRRRVNANANPRRMSLQQPPPAQQYHQKKIDSGMFTDPDFCAEKCELPCQQQLFFSRRDTDAEPGFYCAKIRPPPKAFHEKITDGIGNAGIFEFIVAGVILFAILLCLICTCYQCCCRRPMGSRHRGRSFGSSEEADQAGPVGKVGGPHSLNGGGTLSSGLSPEHESLTNNHMDDGIHPAPLPLPTKVGLNGGAGLSAHGQPLKSSHNNNINSQHQFLPRSSTGGAFSSTGSREQSIV